MGGGEMRRPVISQHPHNLAGLPSAERSDRDDTLPRRIGPRSHEEERMRRHEKYKRVYDRLGPRCIRGVINPVGHAVCLR